MSSTCLLPVPAVTAASLPSGVDGADESEGGGGTAGAEEGMRVFFLEIPIIPTLLYENEYENANNSLAQMNSSPPSSVSSYDSSANFSMYGNSTLASGGLPREENETHSECYTGKEFLQEENLRVGLFLAVKAVLQLIANPIVGVLTNRAGYDAPLFCGFFILFISTLMFAYAESYTLLVVTRALQGIGSSFTSVAGLGMLANVFTDDYERGKAMGITLCGIAVGLLAGPPFGSVMYEFVGKSSPFLVLATLVLLDGIIQMCILKPTKFKPGSVPPTPYRELLSDPYILVAAGCLCIVNVTYGMLEPTLPIWMMQTMCSPRWQLGMAFFPAIATYLLCTNIFGILAHKMGRWLCTMLGMILMGISVMCIPLAPNIYILIGPSTSLGIGYGMVDTAIFPTMAQLVDLRHTSVYGGIYAITDMALCLGYALGPSTGGAIARMIGFKWLMVVFGVLNLVYAPVCFLLCNPPTKEEKKSILNQEGATQTTSYDSQDSPPGLRLSDTSDEEIITPSSNKLIDKQ
ncbi:chromaffin granule amine transporter-like [Rhinophrynus dorsalis]